MSADRPVRRVAWVAAGLVLALPGANAEDGVREDASARETANPPRSEPRPEALPLPELLEFLGRMDDEDWADYLAQMTSSRRTEEEPGPEADRGEE